MSYHSSFPYYRDYTSEDDAPKCADCGELLNTRRDGIFQTNGVDYCEADWLARFDATIAASEQRAADRAGAA